MARFHSLRWFKNRVGKRIYRPETSCKCHNCKKVADEGLIITDEFHAQCLHAYHLECGYMYQDKPTKTI